MDENTKLLLIVKQILRNIYMYNSHFNTIDTLCIIFYTHPWKTTLGLGS